MRPFCGRINPLDKHVNSRKTTSTTGRRRARVHLSSAGVTVRSAYGGWKAERRRCGRHGARREIAESSSIRDSSRSPSLARFFRYLCRFPRRVGNVYCLDRARLRNRAAACPLIPPRGELVKRSSTWPNSIDSSSKQGHRLTWHASDRGPCFSLPRAGVLGRTCTDKAKNALTTPVWPPDAVRDTFTPIDLSSHGLHAISNTLKRS